MKRTKYTMKTVSWKTYIDELVDIKIHRGMNSNWFVKVDSKLIAGFSDKDDAIVFVEARFPNAKQKSDF